MDIRSFLEGLGDKKEVLVKKALQCKSAEELLVIAQENDVVLDETGAEELFAATQLRGGKLSDDELDAVAGGAQDKPNNFKCYDCGHQFYNRRIGTTISGVPCFELSACPKCHSKNIINII